MEKSLKEEKLKRLILSITDKVLKMIESGEMTEEHAESLFIKIEEIVKNI